MYGRSPKGFPKGFPKVLAARQLRVNFASMLRPFITGERNFAWDF